MKALALTISQEALLVDTHIDMPYRLQESWADVTSSAPDRNFDYLRAHFGGLNAPFMSIYTPAEMEETGGAFLVANQLIDSVEALAARAPNKFAMAHTPQQAEAAVSRGLIALALGMENGAPIEGDLEKLQHFQKRGVRYVTLAHSKSNHISDSSYDENRPWGGLSPFGREVVTEMNHLGIMVDVSHLSDEAFYDVLEATKTPVIASHSSARHFTPDWERNMSDEMIVALANNGGVIMINFGSTFLTKAAREWRDEFGIQRDAWSEETGHGTDSPEAKAFELTYREKVPFPYSDVADVADHFDHVIDLVGIEHVGIGSDYDGVGDSLPVGLKDVGGFPNLVEEFLRRGYSRADIEAVLGGNLMRVWREVEQFADSHSG
ncbi:MAG TPA: dipeptidase [Xanthomonadales bacterium]|nr:dipeptidase [Xanthomonadales bacterium]